MNIFVFVGPTVSFALLGLLYLMIAKSRRMQTDIQYIIGSIIFVALGNIFTLFPSQILAGIGQILLSFGFVILFYHYESVANTQPNRFMYGLVFSLFSGSTAFIIVVLTQIPNLASNVEFNIFLSTLNADFGIPALQVSLILFFYLQTILGVVILVRGIYIMIHVTKTAKILATKLELLALVLITIYKILFFPRFWLTGDEWMQISSISLVFSILGIIMLISNYIINPDYLYALPFPIHKFMLYNRAGMMCYTRKLAQNTQEMEEKEILISGAFSAISALIQETLGNKAKIKHINAQQYQINFCPLPANNGNLVVIAYGDTAIFSKSLTRFAKMIPTEIVDLINDNMIQMDKIETVVDKMIQQYFPYVRFSNVV